MQTDASTTVIRFLGYIENIKQSLFAGHLIYALLAHQSHLKMETKSVNWLQLKSLFLYSVNTQLFLFFFVLSNIL